MAEGDRSTMLAPPAVVALKEEAAGAAHHRVQMERSVSQDIREQREDLKEAAEHSLNVIMDLDLDGKIRWVSPSWTKVIGTLPEEVHGKPVSDILIGNSNQFTDTMQSMKKDDSRSQIIRFSMNMGPFSELRPRHTKYTDEEQDISPNRSPERRPEEAEEEQILNLEAQGIMVYDRTTGGESHVRILPSRPLISLTMNRPCG